MFMTQGAGGSAAFLVRGSQSVLRSSQGIRGYISVMATLKFTYFLN
jgi:hypothetical protein